MDAFDTLTQYSSIQRSFIVSGVPTPSTVSISKAYLMLKTNLSDADGAALVSLTITGSPNSSGVVTDNGAGDGSGQLDFVIGNNALSAITDFNATYYATVKVILSNANAYTLSEYPVKILKSGISAIS